MQRRTLITLTSAAAMALLASPQIVRAQTVPANRPTGNRMRFAGGVSGGNYEFVGHELRRRTGDRVFQGGIEVMNTGGSVDNINQLAEGMADIGIAQADVFALYIKDRPDLGRGLRVLDSELYLEYIHLLAPTATGWDRVNDVGKASQRDPSVGIMVGGNTSGASFSWRTLAATDTSGLYSKVQRLPDEPGRTALTKVRADGSKTCMLWISALNSENIQFANRMSAQNGKQTISLLDFNDRDMINFRGPDGKPMYRRTTITRVKASGNTPGQYDNLMSSSKADVLGVPAILIVRTDWLEAITARRSDALVQAIEDGKPTFRAPRS